jgi:hypothetical protein
MHWSSRPACPAGYETFPVVAWEEKVMEQSSVLHRGRENALSYTVEAPHVADDHMGHAVALNSHPSAKKKGRIALLWGMGGTILSAVGFIALALFEQYNGMLSELRADLKHFNETATEFVRRDSFQRMKDQMKEMFKEHQAGNVMRAQMEQELKASEKIREELAHELQKMRERLAFIEGRQTASPTVEVMSPAKD